MQMNCSDVPRRLYKSVGGFGTTLQTACSSEQDHRHSQVTHRCQSLSSFQCGKEQHLTKNCQEAGKGRNQEDKEEKEETPSSCMGSGAGELPAAGLSYVQWVPGFKGKLNKFMDQKSITSQCNMHESQFWECAGET